MVRPLTIHEKPIFVPYVCIQCGLGEGRREWFLDLGFAIDNYFSVDNQAIYLCNECYNDMTLTVGRLIQTFRQDHEKWNSEEIPTYSWANDNMEVEEEVNSSDVRESEPIGPDAVPPGYVDLNEGTDSSTDGNDQDSESDDPEPELTDSGDAESIDDSDTDESDRQTFTAFFGDRGT